MPPAVSVVLPFRDAATTLDAALDGLLARREPPLEVLAVDDGSTDGGPARVGERARRDPRLRLLRTHGRGLVAALREGVEASGAPFLARMDADDRCHPDRLARQLEAMGRRPRLGALGSRVRAAGEAGEGMRRYVAWQNGLLTPEAHRRELFVESPLCHPSVMLRRDALEAVGGYRDVFGPEDYELWLRLDAAGWELAKLPEVLLDWVHAAGRATFTDGRYALERFRAIKAPFLSGRVRASGRQPVLWGAGPTGKRLARALERCELRPAFFVDIDPAKVGSRARDRPIRAPDALRAGRDCVVAAVGARGARALIRDELRARGFTEGRDAWFAA